MRSSRSVTARVLYACTFCLLLPVLLCDWARETAAIVRLPVPQSSWLALAVAGEGVALLLSGWLALAVHGGGLPMNAFPPRRLVREEVYRYLAHPIHTGFVFLSAGVALVTDSASGLWLVTPVAAAGCAALVLGYEHHDLKRRFGSGLPRPLYALPPAEDGPPTFGERLSFGLLVLFPWLVVYEAAVYLGAPHDALVGLFSFEQDWPVIQWTEALYASLYPAMVLAPFTRCTRCALRRLCLRGLLATLLGGLIFFTLPVAAPARPFTPDGFWGELLALERVFDLHTASAVFPAFHVIWAFLVAAFYAETMRRCRWAPWLLAVLVSASCITTGMHALVDLAAGFAVFVVCWRWERIWEWMRRRAETVANSWKEWRIGPVRVINHGAYAATGAFAGVFIMGTLIGAEHLTGMIVVSMSAIVVAGLWAQLVEGGSVSLRPFGYYGSVVGAGLGAVIVDLADGDGWSVIAALAVAAPWVQAIGRLRCLAQGCCHGSATSAAIGIRFTHPRSRVVRLSSLGGVPVHPTQLYSILWNIVAGMILARLWFVEVPLSFVAGMYLVLAGLGRFVEESYRGEPQTPSVVRLPIYQWNAIASVVIGAVITGIDSAAVRVAPRFDVRVLAAALAVALFTGLAYGVDFPDSNRRFARLVK